MPNPTVTADAWVLRHQESGGDDYALVDAALLQCEQGPIWMLEALNWPASPLPRMRRCIGGRASIESHDAALCRILLYEGVHTYVSDSSFYLD